MTDQQWETLKAVVKGEKANHSLTGFIIDCPWLPEWSGNTILDYFSNDEIWLKANLKAIETFPDTIFLPGFWSEYGMCTEPSAFGSKCKFFENEFPFAEKIIYSSEDIYKLEVPDPEIDGLLPFMLNRLMKARPKIESVGHKIRFSVSRGPLNIASFLMGTTEFLTLMMLEPEATHKLLRVITDFLKKWHQLQHDKIQTIDGMMMLDDIVGFIGEDEFREFAFPYLKELYDTNDSIKLFHNDADCTQSVRFYSDAGVNLYNPGIHMTLTELRKETNNNLAILGNIPPRDILAAGTVTDVIAAANALKLEAEGFDRIIFSCAGGMPPKVSTENINAFVDTLK
jgi:uroporphyrinogen-III decarboxylase